MTTTAAPAGHPAPTAELLFRPEDATHFSLDESTIKDWSLAEDLLRTTPKAWLSTVRADGRPHSQPVMITLAGGLPAFTARPDSVKARNLARDGRVTLTASGPDLDLVLEGRVERAVSAADLDLVAGSLLEKFDWEFPIRDGRPWQPGPDGEIEYAFYLVRPVRGYGYGVDGQTATRWVF